MDTIGRCDEKIGCTVDLNTNPSSVTSFDDLMLREWARKNLIFHQPPAFLQLKHDDDEDEDDNYEEEYSLQQFYDMSHETIPAGTVVRASSANRSPFLLDNQQFHKSLLLITQDNEEMSVGILLNLPSAKTVNLRLVNRNSFVSKRTMPIPLRFGGEMQMTTDDREQEEDTPAAFLHFSSKLRNAKVGEPVGTPLGNDGIWECTIDDVTEAIAKNIASPQDFIAVDGFCIWPKDTKHGTGGIGEEIHCGNFELVSQGRVHKVFDVLLSQHLLSADTIDENLELSNTAWSIAGNNNNMQHTFKDEFSSDQENQLSEEEVVSDLDSDYVYKSDVKVSDLGDEALRMWIAAYLLDDPLLCE